MAFVSITKITLKNIIQLPTFYFHTVRSFNSMKNSEGIIDYKVSSSGMTYFTLILWNDKDSMIKFVQSPKHVNAMKWYKSKNRAKGNTYNYQSNILPEWKEAKLLVNDLGREV